MNQTSSRPDCRGAWAGYWCSTHKVDRLIIPACAGRIGGNAVARSVPLAGPGARESRRIAPGNESDHITFGDRHLRKELSHLPPPGGSRRYRPHEAADPRRVPAVRGASGFCIIR